MTPQETAALIPDLFAPWVQRLGVEVIETGETCRFTFDGSSEMVRGGGEGGGVVCGQAIASAADTCSVLALTAMNGRFRPCTTVDLTSHFLRPVPEGDVTLRITAASNGRRMAVTRVEVTGATGKLGAVVTCAFAYLDG